ncbi:7TM diverse intracellular signaling [compost metagenome]
MFSQSLVDTLYSDRQKLKNARVLVDSGYTLQQVISDKQSSFKPSSVLKGAKAYWIQLIVFNAVENETHFKLNVLPNWNNTLYVFNRQTKKWQSQVSSLSTISNIQKELGLFSFKVSTGQIDTLYLKANVDVPNLVNDIFKLKIKVVQTAADQEQEGYSMLLWFLGLGIISSFFIHNLYIYFSFRDWAIRYYLIIQIGGAFYLTGYLRQFDTLFSIPIYQYSVAHRTIFYDLNLLLEHLGIIAFLYGFIALTRSYLDTKVYLPFQDKVLKYLMWIYIVLSFIIMPINVFSFNIEYYTIVYDNIYCMLLILAMLYTCIIAYHRKVRGAGAFLLASLIILSTVLIIPINYVFFSKNEEPVFWLPSFVIASQALFFSIALVSRSKLIQDDLRMSELESKQLAFDLREVGYLNKLNELEMQYMNAEIHAEKERNELLQEKLEINQRELASSTLYAVQKNELLRELKNQIKDLNRTDRYHKAKHMEEITSLLDHHLQLDTDWHSFKIHFEQVHPQFFELLEQKYPNLTQKEVRLYAYFHMKLSHKEIGALLGIDPASVRRAKTRLMKKIDADGLL